MRTNLIVIVALSVLVSACRSNSRPSFEGDSRGASYKSETFSENMETIADEASVSSSNANMLEPAKVDKKIIKTAFISMEVSSYESSRKKLGHILTNYKAYIISENLQNTNELMTNTINIRVPVDLFDRLINEINKIAKRIDYQNIDSQDITEEYFDVETRIKNKKKVEQSYLKLLRKANNVDDILKIENKLGEIRGEIESAEGRLKYLKHQVEFSTINLTIYQKLEYTYQSEESPKFFQRLKRALDSGWKATISFLLFLLKIWPFWIIILIGYSIWRMIKHFKRKKKHERKLLKKQKKNSVVVQQNQPDI